MILEKKRALLGRFVRINFAKGFLIDRYDGEVFEAEIPLVPLNLLASLESFRREGLGNDSWFSFWGEGDLSFSDYMTALMIRDRLVEFMADRVSQRFIGDLSVQVPFDFYRHCAYCFSDLDERFSSKDEIRSVVEVSMSSYTDCARRKILPLVGFEDLSDLTSWVCSERPGSSESIVLGALNYFSVINLYEIGLLSRSSILDYFDDCFHDEVF